jgi:hypothetical protein
MKGFEASKVTYMTDVIKATVDRAEGLPPKLRNKPCIFEAEYDEVVQPSGKRQVDGHGTVECAAALFRCACRVCAAHSVGFCSDLRACSEPLGVKTVRC